MTRTGRGPFTATPRTTRWLMTQVLLALAPIAALGVARHGAHVLALILTSVATAWLSERLACHLDARPHDPADLSPLVTGALLALTLPPRAPLALAAAGALFAILVGKHLTGGLGTNPFNPALLARVLLQWGYPDVMNAGGAPDALSAASPLQATSVAAHAALAALWGGQHAGAIGEVGALTVLICGLYLVLRDVVAPGPPAAYLGTVFLLALVLPASTKYAGHAPWLAHNPLQHVLSGGALLAAFFFVTDPVTAPLTARGKLAFASLAGALTVLIRFHGPYPEGVAYAVLIANAARPLIDDATRPRPLGR